MDRELIETQLRNSVEEVHAPASAGLWRSHTASPKRPMRTPLSLKAAIITVLLGLGALIGGDLLLQPSGDKLPYSCAPAALGSTASASPCPAAPATSRAK